MFALKQEANGRIQSARLKDCGINGIDKRRRSEALWFVENETEARQFIQASKKGFTSLTALQAAMRKAEKASEPKAETHEQPEAETESNVGLTESETQEQSPITASDIALDLMVKVEMLAVSEKISEQVAFKAVMQAIHDQAVMLDKAVA